MSDNDVRDLLFGDAPWYGDLSESSGELWVAWRVVKSDAPSWWRDVLEVAAAFARDHDLLGKYRARFAQIPVRHLTQSVADREHRSPSSPIWEIANELIVARYLERALGWTFEKHEPPGHRRRKGDWRFKSSTGRSVFVEVKSLTEPPPRETGVISAGIETSRLTSVLRGAYRQLPKEGCSTLVVVVGMHQILRIPFGIVHGDLFQTLFGRMEMTFNVMPFDPSTVKVAPSFRDRFLHSRKHRRLGCAAGLLMSGLDTPGLALYAIHNPYSVDEVRMTPSDFPGVTQFWVNESGTGLDLPGSDANKTWELMSIHGS